MITVVCRTSHEVRGLKLQKYCYQAVLLAVAPHTRCVDWNKYVYAFHAAPVLSHLTRGAWIEIMEDMEAKLKEIVAPHTRCVDWNTKDDIGKKIYLKSHLTRGAWIEISRTGRWWWTFLVAPHTRCVDWNIYHSRTHHWGGSRTSHEVRGLKCDRCICIGSWCSRTSHEVRGLK